MPFKRIIKWRVLLFSLLDFWDTWHGAIHEWRSHLRLSDGGKHSGGSHLCVLELTDTKGLINLVVEVGVDQHNKIAIPFDELTISCALAIIQEITARQEILRIVSFILILFTVFQENFRNIAKYWKQFDFSRIKHLFLLFILFLWGQLCSCLSLLWKVFQIELQVFVIA